jgi:hypothetical protein
LSAILALIATPCSLLVAEPEILSAVSWAAWAQRWARVRTSSATTPKPIPGLAGAGRLDGGVQRQDVGLEGDLIDCLDDLRNLRARGLDRGHGGLHLLHVAGAGVGGLAGLGGQDLGGRWAFSEFRVVMLAISCRAELLSSIADACWVAPSAIDWLTLRDLARGRRSSLPDSLARREAIASMGRLIAAGRSRKATPRPRRHPSKGPPCHEHLVLRPCSARIRTSSCALQVAHTPGGRVASAALNCGAILLSSIVHDVDALILEGNGAVEAAGHRRPRRALSELDQILLGGSP